MTDAQRMVVTALGRWLPPLAVEHLLRKTLHEVGVKADDLSPNEWARLLRGPLAHNLVQALPLPGIDKELANIADQMSTSEPVVNLAPFEPNVASRNGSIREEVDLTSPVQRANFMQELARLDHVQGVALIGPGYREMRFPEAHATLPHALEAFFHRLASAGDYGVVYVEMADGIVVARRLEQGSIALFIRPGGNIGQFIYALDRIGKARRYSR